jgi:antitoxin VapB
MTTTAKIFMHGCAQAVRLPKEFRFEGTEVRVSKVGDKVILEPLKKPPFDVEAWFARLDEYRDIPFMEDGREQDGPTQTWAKIDALRDGEDLFPESGVDEPLTSE